MSCVLRIAGKMLDIDDLVMKSGLTGFTKRYKTENISSETSQEKQYSFISALISEADLQNFKLQIADAIFYLKKNRKKLAIVQKTKEVDYATIDFMIELKSVSKEYFAQYIYLPNELISLCGKLNIGIEVAIV